MRSGTVMMENGKGGLLLVAPVAVLLPIVPLFTPGSKNGYTKRIMIELSCRIFKTFIYYGRK